MNTRFLNPKRWTIAAMVVFAVAARAQSGSAPLRWQAAYTQIYFDDIETIAPALSPAFVLEGPGSLTSQPSEVISGKTSIKAAYSGSNSNPPFLQTNASVVPLTPNHTYTVSFQYKILIAPSDFFYVQFLSFVAASQQAFLKGALIQGAAGATGAITLTTTLGNYSDYVVYWGTGGTTAGAISIDNIQITDAATGKALAFEDAEGTAPGPKTGIQLENATGLTGAQAISGNGSAQLNGQGALKTNPVVLPLAANTVYTIKFDYRILSRGTGDILLFAWFQPAGTTDPLLQVTIPGMLKNAAASGTFSSGAQTAGASSYVLELQANTGASIIIDNIFVYRQDVVTQSARPPTWNRLLTTPFPRLGNFFVNRTDQTASLAFDEGTPFTYNVEQIENRLAFSDIIAGIPLQGQTQDPDSIRRIRALNPNVVIVPETYIEQQLDQPPPSAANIDVNYRLLQSTPKAWKATDTAGNVVYDRNYPNLFFMNLSDFLPAVNGQTWRSALQDFITTQVFPSGLWDGIFLSNTHAVLDPAFPHFDDPALFNYDWNRNGLRDETPAATSDMVRAAKIHMLQQINSSADGMQLAMGHTALPEFALAPLVNGYALECFNLWWGQAGASNASSSPARWRTALDAYLHMQAVELPPQANILEGCGASAAGINTPPSASDHYLAPTPDDIAKHRFTMGTALLGNGFYDYDLKDPLGAPYWFDEYSVDSTGKAVEDRTKKGYLGQPLSGATELTNPGTLIFQEGFESGAVPRSFSGAPGGFSVTRTPGEVISGTGSLVIGNPDHTKQDSVGVSTNPAMLPLLPGVTYLLTFDWRILETLDFDVGFAVFVSAGSQTLDLVSAPGVVTGDSGTLRFPLTIPSAGNWTVNIFILNGGGKIAIDDVKVYQGGVGPWRRDFENGLVLVNPFGQPHTFSAAELAGALHRSGIRRIKGAQSPEINNGLPVSGDLTLGAFDAIILLADRIAVATPAIAAAATPGGFPDIAQNGWIEIKGTNLAPPGAAGGLTWDKTPSLEFGIMPTELGGVRVTINGKPAFVYFVSQNQVNVLCPLDNTTGRADIVVTSGGISSGPLVVTLREAAPSFPRVGSTKYVVATHADYSLVGPPSLSTPGYAFSPARRGETIILYVFGLGLPSAPLVNGASTQSGSLPVLPRVQIGGADATVSFAGVISPGLYQLNIIVPSGIPSGDSSLTLTYNGQNSPSGNIVTIQ